MAIVKQKADDVHVLDHENVHEHVHEHAYERDCVHVHDRDHVDEAIVRILSMLPEMMKFPIR